MGTATFSAETATTAESLGEYSVVRYIHQLRGERVNLGVLVWHPSLGHDLRFTRNLRRVRSIDEGADLDRVRRGLEDIRDTVQSWQRTDESPLGQLAVAFRYGLAVSAPMRARICSPSCTLERLYMSLMAPEPYFRASSTRQFTSAFSRLIKGVLQQRGITDVRTNFVEDETFQPVKVAAWYKHIQASYLWRTFSFAPLSNVDQQLTLAKAIHAENEDLKALAKYSSARLAVAVQMPKPDSRAEWSKVDGWLHREAERVEVFEDKESLDEKVPELIA